MALYVDSSGHLLDVIIPEIVCQLFGRTRAVFIFFFVLSCGLKNSVGKPGSRGGSGRCRDGTYRCLSDVLGDIDVDHSVAFADDPSNVVLLGISLPNVSNCGLNSLSASWAHLPSNSCGLRVCWSLGRGSP